MNLNKKNWTNEDYKQFLSFLESKKNEDYKNFEKTLMPEVDNLLGIKPSEIKKIARDICNGNENEFLNYNTNTYYEENLLHGFIITNTQKINNEIMEKLDNYLQNINDCTTCDLICNNFKIIKKNKEAYLKYIYNHITSNNPWKKRFAYKILINYYLEESYLTQIFTLAERYNTEDHNVNMAVAELISSAYLKYPNMTLPFISNNKLNALTQNNIIKNIKRSPKTTNNEKMKLNKLKKQERK